MVKHHGPWSLAQGSGKRVLGSTTISSQPSLLGPGVLGHQALMVYHTSPGFSQSIGQHTFGYS